MVFFEGAQSSGLFMGVSASLGPPELTSLKALVVTTTAPTDNAFSASAGVAGLMCGFLVFESLTHPK